MSVVLEKAVATSGDDSTVVGITGVEKTLDRLMVDFSVITKGDVFVAAVVVVITVESLIDFVVLVHSVEVVGTIVATDEVFFVIRGVVDAMACPLVVAVVNVVAVSVAVVDEVEVDRLVGVAVVLPSSGAVVEVSGWFETVVVYSVPGISSVVLTPALVEAVDVAVVVKVEVLAAELVADAALAVCISAVVCTPIRVVVMFWIGR